MLELSPEHSAVSIQPWQSPIPSNLKSFSSEQVLCKTSVDTCERLDYLFTRLKMDYRRYNEAEREYWAYTKAQGKRRFILREIIFNIILWLGVTIVVDLTDRPYPSVRSVAITAAIMLPVFLLGGYLSGRWKWSDFEKKYPE